MSRTHVTVSFATHSNVSSISSHTACYLGRPKQLATEIANRRKAICQIACSKRTTVCRIFSCQRAAECFLPHPASNLLVARHGGPTFAACGSFGAQPSHGLPIHPRAPRYGGQADLACQTEARLTVRRRAKVGGEYRARTGDLLVANQALSQLS